MKINLKMRFAAVLTLGGDTTKLPPEDLISAAASPDWRVRQAVAQALASRTDIPAETLVALAADDDCDVRQAVAQALASRGLTEEMLRMILENVA